jgi:hypothetical protein
MAHYNDRNTHNDNNNYGGGEQNEGNTDGGCEDGSPGAPPHLFISFLMLMINPLRMPRLVHQVWHRQYLTN